MNARALFAGLATLALALVFLWWFAFQRHQGLVEQSFLPNLQDLARTPAIPADTAWDEPFRTMAKALRNEALLVGGVFGALVQAGVLLICVGALGAPAKRTAPNEH